MIDAPAVIRDYLTSQSALTALTSTRIWAERATPMTGYAPIQGGAIAFRIRGGVPIYRGSLVSSSVQFKCYGANEAGANTVYRALFDVLHNTNGGAIKSAYMDILGQTLSEPNTTPPWWFVLTFYTIWLGV